ncbi:hypothetical protein CP49_32955 [Bradyrhizobium valentinum]|uniref:Uncharacterized protein n=2 Tax=Bradyrhizobium valentinum TaxID=1518501 RepID=A0A0R3KMG3_9BRAD|nr:hypothetical protein CP49_32955 [Bradyrhizobium valentinum]
MPAPLLRDQDGKILTHDHPEILDDDYVLRHIVPPHDLHPDTDKGVTRVASGAYSESSDGGMSADILRWMAEHHGAVWGIKQSHRRRIARVAITVRRAQGET